MSLEALNERYVSLARDVVSAGRVLQMNDYVQHGNTTTLMHTMTVAYRALALARGLRLKVDERSLVRGAILHDFYLYDWHDPEQALDRWHGYTHPRHALNNALQDFDDITDIERDVISRHMFPFHPLPPRTLEGWIVCMSDKLCTTQEFFAGRRS